MSSDSQPKPEVPDNRMEQDDEVTEEPDVPDEQTGYPGVNAGAYAVGEHRGEADDDDDDVAFIVALSTELPNGMQDVPKGSTVRLKLKVRTVHALMSGSTLHMNGIPHTHFTGQDVGWTQIHL